ncbi:MAG: hypothetical protein FWC89_05120 [Defluviitaleaceae bacterium]|nr:hypothetical protein [Defluviitaleaceae bacterium]
MTSSMWNISLDDGTLGNLTPPDEIVAIQCKHLENMTGGKIIAKISPNRVYDDNYPDDNTFKFEFFLTSTFTPAYKYSVMFISHKIEYYPLTVEIDHDIAKEMDISIFVTANDEEEFISILSKIINSEKVKKVINSLYSMIKSHERKNDAFFEKRVVKVNENGIISRY